MLTKMKLISGISQFKQVRKWISLTELTREIKIKLVGY